MAAEVIKSSLPNLVTAVSDCVQSVSVQCLAKGLIPESVYKRVLESGVATSEDKARTLLQAVKNSIETDERCFELFLNTLEEELPYAVRDRLISDLAKGRATAVVPVHNPVQSQALALTSGEIVKDQKSLLGRLEDAIRQHERTCGEKAALEQKLEAKERENMSLKAELENVKSYPSVDRSQELESTASRISACEAEVSKLKVKIEELQCVLEEQGMQVKRGRSTVNLGLVKWSQQVRTYLEKKQNEESELLRARVQSLEEEIKSKEVNYQHKRQREAKSQSLSSEEELPPLQKAPKLGSVGNKSVEKDTRPELRDFIVEVDEWPTYSKWENLGILLQVKYAEIQYIRSRHRSDNGESTDEHACLRDVLNLWLQREDPLPTITELIEALDHMELSKEAEKLRTKFGLI